jgi:hypothetical protein
MSRREISGRLLPQQDILSTQRLERNEPVSNHRLTYKAISESESVIKIGGLLFLSHWDMKSSKGLDSFSDMFSNAFLVVSLHTN